MNRPAGGTAARGRTGSHVRSCLADPTRAARTGRVPVRWISADGMRTRPLDPKTRGKFSHDTRDQAGSRPDQRNIGTVEPVEILARLRRDYDSQQYLRQVRVPSAPQNSCLVMAGWPTVASCVTSGSSFALAGSPDARPSVARGSARARAHAPPRRTSRPSTAPRDVVDGLVALPRRGFARERPRAAAPQESEPISIGATSVKGRRWVRRYRRARRTRSAPSSRSSRRGGDRLAGPGRSIGRARRCQRDRRASRRDHVDLDRRRGPAPHTRWGSGR